jgi:hypothetical protein
MMGQSGDARDTAGAASENQHVVVELTNISYCDILDAWNCRDGLVDDDTSRWLFAPQNSE